MTHAWIVQVAVKVLPEHVAADPELTQRFVREAKTLAALSHPHICPVFDVGRQDGIDFLVIEMLEGATLANQLAKGALPIAEALAIAIQIADAHQSVSRVRPRRRCPARSGRGRWAGRQSARTPRTDGSGAAAA